MAVLLESMMDRMDQLEKRMDLVLNTTRNRNSQPLIPPQQPVQQQQQPNKPAPTQFIKPPDKLPNLRHDNDDGQQPVDAKG